MEELPSDILFSLAIHLDLPDLLHFCSSSNRINNILCKKEPIWRYKLKQDFSNDMTNFASLSKIPKELYILFWNLRDIKRQLKLEQDLFAIYNLEGLDLSYKNLTKLPSSIHVLKNLKILYVYNNKLTELPSLPPSLQSLSVSNNKLTELPSLLPSLQTLIVSNNKLTELPSLPPSLQKLYVSNNKLTELPSLPPSLQYLDVSNNKLTKLPSLPPSLQELYVENNKLSKEEITFFAPFFAKIVCI